MSTDRYGTDVLATDWRAPKRGRAVEAPAELGAVVEEVQDDFCGEIVAVARALICRPTVLFADDYSKANPHMRYFVGEHGYGLVTVTPEDLRCEFHYIEDEWDPDSPLSHEDTGVVRDGEREAQPL